MTTQVTTPEKRSNAGRKRVYMTDEECKEAKRQKTSNWHNTHMTRYFKRIEMNPLQECLLDFIGNNTINNNNLLLDILGKLRRFHRLDFKDTFKQGAPSMQPRATLHESDDEDGVIV
jgi:hypothetical protein